MHHGVLRDGTNDHWAFLMISVQQNLFKATVFAVCVYSFVCLLEILFSSRSKAILPHYEQFWSGSTLSHFIQ